jgi:valyl-tRNA synthetase
VEAETEVGWFIDLVSEIRSIRSEMNVPGSTLVQVAFVNPSVETQRLAKRWDPAFNPMARVSGTTFENSAPQGSVQLVVRGEAVALPLKGLIDIAAERARLAKEMARADADIARVDGKLGNPNFTARAPEEVVEEEKEKREEALARRQKIAEAAKRLEGAA